MGRIVLRLAATRAAHLFRERPIAAAVTCFVVLSGFHWLPFARMAPLGAYNDDAHYYLAATGIAESGKFVNLCLPGYPPQIAYAVGYPLLIAPLIKLFPHSTAPISFLHLCVFAVSAGLVAFLAFRTLLFTDALIAVSWWFTGTLPSFIAGAFMSDIPYLAASLTPFALLECAEVGHAAAIGIALSAAAAVLIRPLGLLLIPAVALHAGLKRTRPEAVRILGWSAAIFAAAAAASLALSGFRGFASLFVPEALVRGLLPVPISADMPRFTYLALLVKSNCIYYADAVLNVLVLPVRPVQLSPACLPLLWFLRILWLPAFATGCWIQLRRRDGLTIYGALYSIFLLCWFLVDLRYLIPLRPLILILTLAGFRFWEERRRWARTAKHVFLAAAVYLGAADVMIQWKYPPQIDEPKYSWISAHTEPDARIADEIDGTLRLYTRRFAYAYPWDSRLSPREIIDALLAGGVRYFVVYPELAIVQPTDLQIREAWHQRQRGAVYAELQAARDFELVFESKFSRVYKLRAP